jgi:hypothetical protein
MSEDLEHPLLADSASADADVAHDMTGDRPHAGWWWTRVQSRTAAWREGQSSGASPSGLLSLPAPTDAHAWLHAQAVAHRPGGPAAAAVANLSNTSA